jgi:hypothetical protein
MLPQEAAWSVCDVISYLRLCMLQTYTQVQLDLYHEIRSAYKETMSTLHAGWEHVSQ